MYSVNSIDLQSSEYEELKMLVEAEERGDDAAAVAKLRLQPDGQGFDSRACEVYAGLESVGLVTGLPVLGGFVFDGITQKGADFVRDYERSVEDERKRTREQRTHDYKVALFSLLGGAIAGGAITLILHFAFGL